MKIKTALIIVGTRPEVIKMAPVVAQLKATTGWSVRVCFTGQHEDLGMQMLDWWGIEIDARCSIMEEHQGLNLLLSKALVAIDAVLEEQAPDIVLVQGDTTSCLAGAMAAFQRKIPVAHVEAGLRTNNKYSCIWYKLLLLLFFSPWWRLHSVSVSMKGILLRVKSLGWIRYRWEGVR